MSNFRNLITDFAANAGIAGLTLDEDGLFRIVIDGETTVDFELSDKDKALLLIGHVVPSVEEAEGDVVTMSLILNAEVSRNKGCFLALDEAEDEMLLLRRLDTPSMPINEFEAVLNQFVGHIIYCRAALLTEGEDDDEVDEVAPPAQEPGMMQFRL